MVHIHVAFICIAILWLIMIPIIMCYYYYHFGSTGNGGRDVNPRSTLSKRDSRRKGWRCAGNTCPKPTLFQSHKKLDSSNDKIPRDCGIPRDPRNILHYCGKTDQS